MFKVAGYKQYGHSCVPEQEFRYNVCMGRDQDFTK